MPASPGTRARRRRPAAAQGPPRSRRRFPPPPPPAPPADPGSATHLPVSSHGVSSASFLPDLALLLVHPFPGRPQQDDPPGQEPLIAQGHAVLAHVIVGSP